MGGDIRAGGPGETCLATRASQHLHLPPVRALVTFSHRRRGDGSPLPLKSNLLNVIDTLRRFTQLAAAHGPFVPVCLRQRTERRELATRTSLSLVLD